MEGWTAAVLALGLSLAALPAAAQSAQRAVPDHCRYAQQPAYAGNCTLKPYQAWGDGTPAIGNGSVSSFRDPGTPSYFMGGYSRLYGFGR